MPRLRRADPSRPGLGRVERDGELRFVDADGALLTEPEEVERCTHLVIPPAWRDVWICPYPNGHIQATGVDDAGRLQYLYHPAWRERRDRAKHEHVLAVARALPTARRRVAQTLEEAPDLGREQVLAVAFRLLDLGYFRAGSETYTKTNGSYGLATLLREHVRVRADGSAHFRYPAKSGQIRDYAIEDEQVVPILTRLKRRRSGGDRLLVWREGARGEWHDVTSVDIVAYVKSQLGEDATAKDFRTWHATVMAARELGAAGPPPTSAAGRKRAMSAVVRAVADELGNTPAVCRASYIDPRLFDLWERGRTIGVPRTSAAAERAVIELLG
ncbi:DNA topoisomerase [Flavimobilis marinus]|uniref:DNA topoisomerase n=1 Tax=Flavimobilis marinus TaxID=285351 RepID=A0A1I2DX62_9MICO|nr:DNA topoisomerase IB [Flavimobilis marinus]GHG44117.1 DNA topoisomerase [Flavimobilis marinus]SFE85057.1 DNA topoisomerase IB [Flavimobilis marinus]